MRATLLLACAAAAVVCLGLSAIPNHMLTTDTPSEPGTPRAAEVPSSRRPKSVMRPRDISPRVPGHVALKPVSGRTSGNVSEHASDTATQTEGVTTDDDSASSSRSSSMTLIDSSAPSAVSSASSLSSLAAPDLDTHHSSLLLGPDSELARVLSDYANFRENSRNGGDEGTDAERAGKRDDSAAVRYAPRPYCMRPPAESIGRVALHSGLSRGPPPPRVPMGEPHDTDGPEHFPYWGEDFEDEPTRLLLLLDPETQRGTQKVEDVGATHLLGLSSFADDRYARPEDADALAADDSIWRDLTRRYADAGLADILNPTPMGGGKKSGEEGEGNSGSGEATTILLAPAPCLLSVVYSRSCLYLDESFEACAKRLGPALLKTVLFGRCRASADWAAIERSNLRSTPTPEMGAVGADTEINPSAFAKEGVPSSPAVEALSMSSIEEGTSPRRLPPGPAIAAQLCSTNTTTRQTPHEDSSSRSPSPVGGPRHCRDGGFHYPIGFVERSPSAVSQSF